LIPARSTTKIVSDSGLVAPSDRATSYLIPGTGNSSAIFFTSA